MGMDYLDGETATIYRGGSELAFRKGVEGRQIIMLLSSQGAKNTQPYPVHLLSSYNAGMAVTDVLGCRNYTVDGNGQLTISMEKGEPHVFFPTDLMPGSGLCGFPASNTTLTELKTGNPSESGAAAGPRIPGVWSQWLQWSVVLVIVAVVAG